jgi:hypothetical protein
MIHARLLGAAAIAGLLSFTAPAFADTAPPNAAQTTQAAPTAPVTDVELRNFAAARAEIEPLNARPATTDADRQANITAMRTSLQNHSLTGVRYNEIVAAVQADPALQRRLAALTPQRQATPPG